MQRRGETRQNLILGWGYHFVRQCLWWTGQDLGPRVGHIGAWNAVVCRSEPAGIPTGQPSIGGSIGGGRILPISICNYTTVLLSIISSGLALNPSSCLLHVQNAALIDWGWRRGIQKLILNFCRLPLTCLPPSAAAAAYSAASVINWGGQLLRPNSDTRLRWWMMKFMEYRDIAGNHGTQRIPRHCQNSPPDHCAPPGEIPN